MHISALISLVATLSSIATAHPGVHDPPPSAAELARRSLHARAASKCSATAESMKARRRMAKRNIPTSALSAVAPQATIKNSTCVLTPTVTEGPYYLNNELVRTDVAEEQPGVPLTLDIGLMDISTCEPIENIMVEIWHCNSTGSYSYFTTASLDQPGGGGGGGGGMGGSASPPTASSLSKRAQDDDSNDDGTFLRGGYPTNSNGVVEFNTIWPGYYTGRTIHVHVMVRKDYEISDDGTIVAGSGTVVHEGQLFFDESENTKVLATDAYQNTTQQRTVNDDDTILQSILGSGFSPFVDIDFLGDDANDGAYGYIAVGVDINNSINISSTNTLVSLDPTQRASALSAAGLQSFIASASSSAAGSTGSVAAAVVTGVSSAARRFRLF
ncbi:intradiol ring-cleavage dioxygenase [Sporobolomyces salmoneus]|uniref:intradiol ring-cleavage dioxygenase n=1 Tax=Sporobolomyces salmoneus TaxID=183962 RepID=UPI003171CAF2